MVLESGDVEGLGGVGLGWWGRGVEVVRLEFLSLVDFGEYCWSGTVGFIRVFAFHV